MKTTISIALLSVFALSACSNDTKSTAENTTPVKTNQVHTETAKSDVKPQGAIAHDNIIKSEGRRLAELAFDSLDEQGRGYLDSGQMSNYSALVHASMDGDDNSKVSLEEFMSWGYGMQNIAENTDRVRAYQTALKVVYSFWDRNGDGQLTRTEHRKSVMTDFNRADTNGNGFLTKEEYFQGFSLNVALKAALKD